MKLSENDITPEDTYWNRREILRKVWVLAHLA